MRYGLGPEILRDISFHLEPGAFRFLSGPSGAGKSSLLRLMYLAHRPSRGIINIFGQDIATTRRGELPSLRRRIGVVFQDYRLLDHLTAMENVALPLRIMGVDDNQLRAHVSELLNWVGLGDRMNARPATLSGGEKQRVAIARAVITRPKLLVADEPTGNLDYDLGLRLVQLFVELNKLGTTVVVATHNRRLIDRFDFPVLWLSDGELVQQPATPLSPLSAEGSV
jgi:cell division transport system ATP-binding protein